MAENKIKKSDAAAKKNKKHARRLVIILVCAFVALTGLNMLMDSGLLDKIFFGDGNQTDNGNADIEFYTPDYNYDIKNDEAYMDIDKYIAYTEGGVTLYLMNDAEIIKAGENVFMFKLFFDSIINGNAELYNSFFSEEYLKKQSEKSDFTMQRIYDIRIEFYDKNVLSSTQTEYRYVISYKIMKNDGTFRRDIGSDMFKPQLFTVLVSRGSDGDSNDIVITNVE